MRLRIPTLQAGCPPLRDQPLDRIDQALGTLAEPIEPRCLPPAFEHVLPSPSRSAEPKTSPPRPAACWPRCAASSNRPVSRAPARDLAHRVDGSVDRTSIGTSRPNRDNPKLMKLFEERLGELDPGFGVELMILAAPEVEALERHAGRAARPGPAHRRLRRRRHDRPRRPAGAAAGARRTSCGCCRADSHLPERVQVAAAVSSKPAAAGCLRRVANLKGARPTRLLQRPEPVEVTAFVPDDPPSVFRWRHHAHRIVRADGPERIADEWWRPRSDGTRPPAGTCRRYATITASRTMTAAASGCSATGLTQPAANGQPTARWFLHGFCA